MGILTPQHKKTNVLSTGQVGWVAIGMRNPRDALLGDTFYQVVSNSKRRGSNIPDKTALALMREERKNVVPMDGFQEAKPMVYAGIYPFEMNEYDDMKAAIEKLVLTDASISAEVRTLY